MLNIQDLEGKATTGLAQKTKTNSLMVCVIGL